MAAATKSTSRRPSSSSLPNDVKAIADRAMSADPNLASLTQGVSYVISKEGPWTRVREKTRIGVVREITLDRAVNSPMRGWPVIVWDEESDSYQRYTLNARYEKVTKVTVFIDDKAGVVQLSPGAEAVVVPGEGNAWIDGLEQEGGQ